MNQQSQVNHSNSVSPSDGSSILTSAENEDGIITLESLRKALFSAGFDIDAEGFAERASAEGELMRVGADCWKRA
tara:strand:+ start:5276 stop:5500 length:225 start_codon:yes stop_codon:yes gene_type:complete